MDVAEIKATISTALAQRSSLPRYEELCALHDVLVRHIEALMPLAAKQIDGLWHGSREWYRKRSTLDTIPYEVAEGLGPGLLTATSHVKSLGYTLRFLLENAGLAQAGEELAAVHSPPTADI
ncbi:DUF6415 family natural product biosynthesis protein [Streptomyces sp. 891-h]|uniref:DUF6415 family natural product biosynthesis protein n=1 Tax=Streptomyces sp. 891-h TaxID=2720714 RepID=UPI001FA9E5AE|nr:DUF6415 family natural product biosynthesis protein [Streptomyces sp. 891-h]UNZ18506.1 hypothetical protein HC362_17140 [Streptomyces sp. 891-h]